MRVLNVPFQSTAGVRPHLGQAIGSPETAALTLFVSAKAFEGVQGWSIASASWNRDAEIIRNRCAIEVDNLRKNVLGKLGSPEAEQAATLIYESWKSQLEFAEWALANPPPLSERVGAWVNTWFSDFREGAAAGWDAIVYDMTSMSKPILKTYWDSVSKINFLNNDLNEASASGKFSREELEAQARKIMVVEAKREAVQVMFRRFSAGLTIDQVAEGEFGSYKLSGPLAVVAPWVVLIAVVVVAFGYAASGAGGLMDKFDNFLRRPLPEETQRLIMMLIVGAIAVVAVPYILKD